MAKTMEKGKGLSLLEIKQACSFSRSCEKCFGIGVEINSGRLGEKLRQLRISRELSQKSVAEAMSVSGGYLNDLEQGRRDWSLEKLKSYLEACGLTIEEGETEA